MTTPGDVHDASSIYNGYENSVEQRVPIYISRKCRDRRKRDKENSAAAKLIISGAARASDERRALEQAVRMLGPPRLQRRTAGVCYRRPFYGKVEETRTALSISVAARASFDRRGTEARQRLMAAGDPKQFLFGDDCMNETEETTSLYPGAIDMPEEARLPFALGASGLPYF